MRKTLLLAAMVAAVSLNAISSHSADLIIPQGCALGQVTGELQSALNQVAAENNGGLFSPNLMWAAVVDRNGILCGVAKTGDAWPYSRQIAIAKAGTANGLSNNKLALSTANLYSPTQPGGSLYGLNESNPYNPFFNRETTRNELGSGLGFTPGGVIPLLDPGGSLLGRGELGAQGFDMRTLVGNAAL